jgi:UDP-glucose 4-epimerase
MQVLVTGGAGFIGSAVVRKLLAEGHGVRVFDNLETGDRTNVPAGVPLIEGDIRDAAALEAAMAGSDHVVHLAAMVSVALSVAEPERCFDINVTGTRRVLETAKALGVKRVVMASTAAIYGNEPTLPKRETMAPRPESPYAYAKWQNEVDAGYYGRYLGLETVCLRFFNVFGPRQRPDSPYSGVISIAANRLLAGLPFTVNGTGEQTRDFIYVDDVASAVVASLSRPGLSHDVMNVGRGKAITLLELIDTLAGAIGVTPELKFEAPRAGDVLHSLSDASRLERVVSLKAAVPLDRGLAETIAWMRETAKA